MPITFTTKSYADITMLNDVGEEMLKMMGFGKVKPGAIVAKDIPQALANLQNKLANENDQKEQDTADDEDQPSVALSTRAMPLLELLKSASDNDNDISWR